MEHPVFLLSQTMIYEKGEILLLSKYASDKTKTNSLHMHDISFVYEDVTRFRQHVLLTQNGMTFGKYYF